MTTRCVVCNAETAIVHHRFATGTMNGRGWIEKPTRVEEYDTALYHHLVSKMPFCGATCAARHLRP